MKQAMVLLLIFFLFPGFVVWGANRASGLSAGRSAPASRPQPARQPVVINMNRGTSGGNNRNYPPQQSQPAGYRQPSYGQLHWNNPQPQSRPQQAAAPAREGVAPATAYQRPAVQNYVQPGVQAAVAVHHHAYEPGYVRKKLQKIGVSAEPSLITDRSEMIQTDKTHSSVRFPPKGSDHHPITATSVSPRHFNDAVVRDQMKLVDSADWRTRIDQYNAAENQAGHYYWHNDDGVNYCHYLDSNGYHWYGWYEGSQFFWTRDFDGRWWEYDSDYNRWCFWNNGYWWWQDPNHVGDLYCYDNNDYIPCNSQDDQVVVTAPDEGTMDSYASDDGTRMVKIDRQTQDAFLYATANPPGFDPVYMATGVESVTFSDTSNGRPMEIVLKLNDGSFDLFDAQGNSYNPGLLDADEARQGDAPSIPGTWGS